MALIYNASFNSGTRVLSLLDKAGNVISSCEVPSNDVDDATKPLMFKSQTNGATISTNATNLDFSRNGTDWETYTANNPIEVNSGGRVFFKARTNASSGARFTMTGEFKAFNNIMSVYRTDFTTVTGIGLSYRAMFSGQTGLLKAPMLTQTFIKTDSYNSTFNGCTGLEEDAPLPPVLTFEDLPQRPVNSTYYFSNMYSGCTGLKRIRSFENYESGGTMEQLVFATNGMFPSLGSLPTREKYISVKFPLALPVGGMVHDTHVPQNATDYEPFYLRYSQDWKLYITSVMRVYTKSIYKTEISAYEYSYDGETWNVGYAEYEHKNPVNVPANTKLYIRRCMFPYNPLSRYDSGWYYSVEACTRSFSFSVDCEVGGDVWSLDRADFYSLPSNYAQNLYGLFRGTCFDYRSELHFPCAALSSSVNLRASVYSSLQYMFAGCNSLRRVDIAITSISPAYALDSWMPYISSSGDFYCDPNTNFPSGKSGIPANWSRWLYGAEDTGTTTTMYHNGVEETVRVGTSDYGACYALQGWAGFKLLAEMHDLGYTLQAPVSTTMYHNGSTTSVDMIEAGGADGFTEDMYVLDSTKTLAQMHNSGYTFGAQSSLTMYHWEDPVSAYSCDANVNDSFTETMYVGNSQGYLTIAQQNAIGYFLSATPRTELQTPLHFVALENSSVYMRQSNNTSALYNSYEYSFDEASWTQVTTNTVIQIPSGSTIYFRNGNTAWRKRTGFGDTDCFVFTGSVEAYGNVLSLLNKNFESITDLTPYGGYTFTTLFNCSKDWMTTANQNALKKLPLLPATTLTNYCYAYMFMKNYQVQKSPELPATTLSQSCYEGIFNTCSSLSEVRIAATTTATDALENWLSNVSASGDFYCDPNATIFPSGANGIPVGWNRFVLGAEDTGTTTTMYHNGGVETVQVGTSSYGACYALQGWAGFKTLAQMPAFGYTLSAQTPLTMYNYDSPVSAYSCGANVDDGFTETMYDVGDGNGYLTIAQQNANGYYLTATPYTGLTLTATADNSSVKLTKVGTLSNTYEVNVGSGWTAYTFGTVINLNSGENCKWRCSAHPTTQSSSNYVQFVMTGTIEASGNVSSMLSSDFENLTSLSGYDYALNRLFYGCTALTKAPDLPATTLSSYCYNSMFYGCTALTKAPDLPATTLSSYCYSSMFYDCTGLTEAPDLPATTLSIYCYSSMFSGCTALTKAPDLPATTLSSYCYNGMFSGCTALTKAPDLPATTLLSYCYNGMFSGCTALTKAPDLPATTLSRYCYQYMFRNCSSLAEVRIAATTMASNALQNWLNNVAASGTVYADPSLTLPTDSASGVPSGWTREDIANYPTTP